jgi:hypothetical protein
MTQIIRSGAFLQQCWSVHPLCVTVKRMADTRTLVLSCSSCRFTHRLLLGMVTHNLPLAQEQASAPSDGLPDSGETMLRQCIAAHHAAITLRDMDIFQDLLVLRCAECRRHYEVTVSAFETHQR